MKKLSIPFLIFCLLTCGIVAVAFDEIFFDVVNLNQLKFLTTNGQRSVTMKSPSTLSASWSLTLPPDDGTSGQILRTDGLGATTWITPSSPGTGTVTSVSVTTQNGVSATVTNPTTTPALAFTLGAITPTTIVASSTFAFNGSQAFSGVTGNGTKVATGTGTYTPTHGVVVDANGNLVDSGSAPSTGIPGGSNTQVQFNNGGGFGGISGFISDGTNVTAGSGNLRATLPQITTGIADSSGSSMLAFSLTGSAVNSFSMSNAATGGSPSLSVTGSDANIALTLAAKANAQVKVVSTESQGRAMTISTNQVRAGLRLTAASGNDISLFTTNSNSLFVVADEGNAGFDQYVLKTDSVQFKSTTATFAQNWLTGSTTTAVQIGTGSGFAFWIFDSPNALYRLHVNSTTGNVAINTQTNNVGSTLTVNGDIGIFGIGSFATQPMLISNQAPTVTGFGTSPSVPAQHGSAAFTVNVGTGGTASTGTINFPSSPAANTAATGWVCTAIDVTNNASFVTSQTGGTVSTATLQNYSRTTGLPIAWTASDVLRVSCFAY